MIILKNNTRYNTKFLHKVLSIALKYWKKEHSSLPHYLKNIRVTVNPTKGATACTGVAWLNSNAMRLRIPYWGPSHTTSTRLIESHSTCEPKALSLFQDLVFVFFHELMHNRGYRHTNISDPYLMKMALEVPPIPWEYAPTKQEVMQVRAPKKNLLEERYKRAMGLVIKWEKKVKVANNHLKKYKQKVKYYERALSNREKEEGGV